MTLCPAATLESSVWSGDGTRLDGDTLYVLEDDTVQCGWCLEDINFDHQPTYRQIHTKLRPGQQGHCYTCGIKNKEDDA